MKEARFSIPFIGGITVVMTKEEMIKYKDQITAMCKDEKFQKAVYMAVGKTLAVAVALVGIAMIVKWYVAYLALHKAGVAIVYLPWVKWVGVSVVAAAAVYTTVESVNAYKQASALGNPMPAGLTGEVMSADISVQGDVTACPACGATRTDGLCKVHGRR